MIWLINHGEENGSNKEIIKQQSKQLEIKDEEAGVKKFQQKIISKTDANNNIDNRRRFLQSIYEERANSDQ